MGQELVRAQVWVRQPLGERQVAEQTKDRAEIKSPEVVLNLFASASSSL
jgi:hypothetical protein